jgi:hypothetical protein
VHGVEHLIDDNAFWVALVLAIVGDGVVSVRARSGRAEPGFAIVAVVASLVGLHIADRFAVALVVGLLLVLGGECCGRRAGCWTRALWLLPGALVIAAALPDGWPFWIRLVTTVAAAVGGSLTVATNVAAPRLVPALFAVTAVGIFYCVPDTEAPAAVVGALAVGCVLVLEPRLRTALGAAALTGIVAWVTAYGGMGRPGSVVGGIACLGVLLLPIGRVRHHSTRWIVPLLAVQVALVVYESRVAGAESSAWAAAALSVPAFVVAAGVLLLMGRRPLTGA